MSSHATRHQTGFTLIELLLYVSLVGGLLMSVTMFFATTVDSRVKNQSASEVNRQGELAMDYITQTVRNADSIVTPATFACSTTLSVNVPTGGLSPTIFDTNTSGGTTVLGYNVDGTTTDTQNSNFIHATRFTASASGIITSVSARIGATVAASPNNRGHIAVYSGTTAPTALLATSGEASLTANAWNTFCIPPLTVASGTTYWLAYNSNGLTTNDNNLRYHTGTTGQSRFVAQTYGTWPASWTGTTTNVEYSMYATINTGTGSGALRVKEGAAAAVPLTNSKVQVSGLTVQNLSRSGTPGVVRINFVISRINSTGRNEYDYQKAYTATAALRWPL